MADEKYLEIDPATHKPRPIDKDTAQGTKDKPGVIVGVPSDDDLCFITFSEYSRPVVKEEGDKKVAGEVTAFEFSCAPSPTCRAKNKEVMAKYDEFDSAIVEKTALIKSKDKIIGDPAQQKAHATAKKDKAAAEAALTKLNAEKNALPKPCVLTFFVGKGGDSKPANRLSVDEIKDRKIEYVVCHCQKVALPKGK